MSQPNVVQTGQDDPQPAAAESPASPLDPASLDPKWQALVGGGPSYMGRQIGYVLAHSRRHTAPAAPPAPPQPPAQDVAALLALTAIGEHLALEDRLVLLEDARKLDSPADRARVLLALAQHFTGERRRRTLHEAYGAINAAPPDHRAPLLTALLPLLRDAAEGDLPTGFAAEALDIAGSIQDPEARMRSLTVLAPYLPTTPRIALLLAVLDSITIMPNPDNQASALIAMSPHLLDEVHYRTLTVAGHITDPAARARVLTVLADCLPAALQPRLRAAALEAAAAIVNEDDKAEALCAFAPHLEAMSQGDEAFPALLERALSLAVNMSRRDARARALIGLQARLPHHLQGEALAAVNAITDEHTRAHLLAELAPSLPEDLAVAALAVAHDLRLRDARFTALAALGPRLPEKAAARTWQDALAVGMGLPRQLERVMALAAVIPNLPEALASRALADALTSARSIPKERARVRALTTLGPLLEGNEQLLADALADAHMITNPAERISALIGFIPYLPVDERGEKIIDLVLHQLDKIEAEYRRARILTSLEPYLEDRRRHRAIDLAQAFGDPYDRATTLVAMLPCDDHDRHDALLDDAWESAHEITDHYDRATALAAMWPLATPEMQRTIVRAVLDAVVQIEDDYDRASGITVFAPLLAAEELPSTLPPESRILREALLAACRLGDAPSRAAVLRQLVPFWLEVTPTTAAYALWCEALPLLSRRPLAHLFGDLVALKPVVDAIGGPTAAEEAAQAIAAARRW